MYKIAQVAFHIAPEHLIDVCTDEAYPLSNITAVAIQLIVIRFYTDLAI